jgi:hypothetical protein
LEGVAGWMDGTELSAGQQLLDLTMVVVSGGIVGTQEACTTDHQHHSFVCTIILQASGHTIGSGLRAWCACSCLFPRVGVSWWLRGVWAVLLCRCVELESCFWKGG